MTSPQGQHPIRIGL